MGNPVSMGNCKCEHSRRRVRLVLICLVRSTSHTRWMLSRTTNSNIFCTLTHGLGLAVARTVGVRGSLGCVREANASPKHPGEKQGWLAGVRGLRDQGWPPQPSQQSVSHLILVMYQLQYCMSIKSTSSDLGTSETCQEHYEGMHNRDRRKVNKIKTGEIQMLQMLTKRSEKFCCLHLKRSKWVQSSKIRLSLSEQGWAQCQAQWSNRGSPESHDHSVPFSGV